MSGPIPSPTCTRCGTPVPAGARACSSCGADVSGQQGQVATAYVAPGDAGTIALSAAGVLDALRRATTGDYDVAGELGAGGMATVYLAHDLSLDRKVAIKVMSPALLAMPGMVERFKREARTAAALSHPHIIPIFAVKQSQDVVFFVMKFIEGRSLESIMHAAGPLPVPLVQAVLYQAAAALGHAHRAGVVHRDVKPANIMVDKDGWVVVTDFGIAKVAETTGLTMTGATIGTPSYMSPEQCSAKRELDGASDQYSLGVVAYEMLNGAPPFKAETTLGLMFAHVHEPPPPLGPHVPDAVAAPLMRMLAKDPAARFPDVEAAIAALGGAPIGNDDPVRQQLRQLARAGGAADIKRIASTPVSPVPPSRAPQPRRRSRAIWAVPLAAVVVLGAVGALVLGNPGAGPTTVSAPAAVRPAPETVRVEVPVPVPAPAPAAAPAAPESVAAVVPPATRSAPRGRLRDRRTAVRAAGERAEIERAIEAFATAFKSRDLSRVRREYPGMTPAQAQEWGSFFMDARNLDLRVSLTSYDQRDGQIVADVTGGLDWESVKSGRAESRTVSYRATFRRDRSGWTLSSLR